ncbi:MAG: hypothetical protein KAQ74_02030 [Dehalococcoidia bacterium]|nr:hypothetical protein [Dehalococcoidia bacterium]
MNKLEWQAQEIEVTESDQFEPIAVMFGGRKRVECIMSRWRINQEWWKCPVERDYFSVRLTDGILCELFLDMATGCWYLQRVYD